MDGRLSIWAYDNTSGDMYNYLVYLVNGVPSLSSSSNTPIEAEQQGVFFAYHYPHAGVAVASAGPIDMYLQPGSGNADVQPPGLFVATPPASVYTPERIYFYDGSYTSSAAGIPDPKDAVVEGSVTDPNQVTQTTCQNGCLWYYPLQQTVSYSLSATPEFVGRSPGPRPIAELSLRQRRLPLPDERPNSRPYRRPAPVGRHQNPRRKSMGD